MSRTNYDAKSNISKIDYDARSNMRKIDYDAGSNLSKTVKKLEAQTRRRLQGENRK